MTVRLDVLATVANDLSRRRTLEERLQLLVDRTAALLEVPRVVVRLLDLSRGRLIATARAGAPLHLGPGVDFDVGEGLIGWVVQQARPILVGDAEADPRFVPRKGMVEPLGAFVGVPLVAGDRCIGVLGASHRLKHHFTTEHEQALTVLAGLCAPHIEAARLERLADIDALTGALNRRGLHAVLTEKGPASLVLYDIDHFKAINDTHGHVVGDEVLKRLALLLAGVLRAGDAVVRWGGEEFLLVLPGVDVAKAERIAERGRRTVEDEAFAGGLRATVSAGVAERRGAEEPEQLIRRADEALYLAKRAGRNCVRVAR